MPVSDLQHVDCQFPLDSFNVSNVETMMKLNLVAVTLGDCNISDYRQELEEIQDRYFIAKLRMENVFIPNYESMMIILDAYRAFWDRSIVFG